MCRLLHILQPVAMSPTRFLPSRRRAVSQALAYGLAIALPMVPPAHAAPPNDNPLAAERWHTRPLVVVVPASDRALLRRVESALENTTTREAFAEREMVLFSVEAGQGRRSGVALTGNQTCALLRALKLRSDGPPAFVLVGKDGGVKMTEGHNVDLAEVFAAIDRMPMRHR